MQPDMDAGRYRSASALLLGVLLLVSVGAGWSPDAAASPIEPPAAPQQLLVGYHAQVTASQRADARDRVGAQLLERVVPARADRTEVELVGLPRGMSSATAIRRLEADPSVAYAEPNWVVTVEAISNDPYYLNGSLWGLYGDGTSPSNQFGSQAGEAWAAHATGASSVYVGVIDEGIDFNHPDLAANMWTNRHDPIDGIDNDGNGYVDDTNGWDFHNNDRTVYDGGNGDKHGTHVAGTIGAEGGNGIGVAGVAWDVTMISGKFLSPSGGYTSNAVKAVNYFTDLKVRHGLNIVATSNSWGGGGYSQSLHDAIIWGAKNNILFIAAAGNNGTDNDSTIRYPSNFNTTVGTSTMSAASYDAVLAVASTTNTGALSGFSNFGATTVDLGAPGSSVTSTLPKNTYGTYSGTSMATPHVTGAAVLAAAHYTLSGSALRTKLLGSTTATASLAGKTVTGGRLDLTGYVGTAPADSGGSGSDAPPSVTITSPAAGASLTTGTATTLNAAATDDLGVAQVTFYAAPVGGSAQPVATDTTAPYSTSWTPPSDGSYDLTAVAVDSAGQSALSAAVRVSSTTPTPVATSARVEAINYRLTGKNNANLEIAVKVVNNLGQVVSGASVSISVYRTLNGSTSLYGSATANTSSTGVATFVLKNAPSGCYRTDVTAIAASGLSYDGAEPTNQGCK
jgi:subtilisin family serine protease